MYGISYLILKEYKNEIIKITKTFIEGQDSFYNNPTVSISLIRTDSKQYFLKFKQTDRYCKIIRTNETELELN